MSTRGLWGVIIGDEKKLTYNHSDSYPSGMGEEILTFLKRADLNALVDDATALRLVKGEEIVTPEDVVAMREFTENPNGYKDDELDWYWLLRRTQGDPGETFKAGVMIDGDGFQNDSLFCEWAYIIDLDGQKFEIYRGFQESPHDKGRFASHEEPNRSGYYPVALVAEYPLDNLPENLDQVEVDAYGEDEDD